jgi:hypothetical protein
MRRQPFGLQARAASQGQHAHEPPASGVQRAEEEQAPDFGTPIKATVDYFAADLHSRLARRRQETTTKEKKEFLWMDEKKETLETAFMACDGV